MNERYLHAIIPAAGRATRLRGLPKFLLPIDDQFSTLIERHVFQALKVSQQVWIPTRLEYLPLLSSLNFDPNVVHVLPVETKTMSETIHRIADFAKSDHFLMGMPDTYFFGADTVYEQLAASNDEVVAALFQIQPFQKGNVGQVRVRTSDNFLEVVEVIDKDPQSSLEFLWGAIRFSRELMSFSDPLDSHLGYALGRAATSNSTRVSGITFKGRYFDCGTPSEYWRLISELSAQSRPRH